MLLFFEILPLYYCLLLLIIPVFEAFGVVCNIVLFLTRFCLLPMLLHLHSNLDNIEPKVSILLLLRLLYHWSQVSEVLLCRAKIRNHSSLRRQFGFIDASDTSIKFTCLCRSHIFERVSFGRVYELRPDFDGGSLGGNDGEVELIIAEDFGVGFGASISNYSQLLSLHLQPNELRIF